MKLESKYNIGDTVYPIQRANVKTWKPCSFCGAEGRIKGQNNNYRSCPECYNHKGKYIYEPEASWHLRKDNCYSYLTIGRIEVQYHNDAERKTTYMCNETGIHCGTLWDETLLWPTDEDARAECRRLNTQESQH